MGRKAAANGSADRGKGVFYCAATGLNQPMYLVGVIEENADIVNRLYFSRNCSLNPRIMYVLRTVLKYVHSYLIKIPLSCPILKLYYQKYFPSLADLLKLITENHESFGVFLLLSTGCDVAW